MINFYNEAVRIERQFGDLISDACNNTIVPRFYIAGLVFNECGRFEESSPEVLRRKKKPGDYEPNLINFNKVVFNKLMGLKRDGFCIVRGNKSNSFGQITQSDICYFSDEEIRDYAKTYGATQILGSAVIKMLRGSLNDLGNPYKHFKLAVQRVLAVSKFQIEKGNTSLTSLADEEGYFADALRIWSTGNPKGHTHSPTYVLNGLAIMREYKTLSQP